MWPVFPKALDDLDWPQFSHTHSQLAALQPLTSAHGIPNPMLSCGSLPVPATGGYASLRRPKAADAILQPFALVFIRPA
jgi:hypothetical protein